jgi:hypothetical protein
LSLFLGGCRAKPIEVAIKKMIEEGRRMITMTVKER